MAAQKPSAAHAPAGTLSAQRVTYGLGVLPPLTAVFELAAIVSAIMAADWIWPALDIYGVQPSVFWIPVLLLSLQYGTASGVMAVVVAMAAYFSFVALPEQGVGENEFTYRLRVLSQPILWIAAAVLLGQFRMVQIQDKRELTLRLEELEIQRATLADYAQRLRNRCDVLEREIVSRPLNASAPLLEALSMGGDDRGTGQAVVARCLAVALPGASASLFVKQGTLLTKAVSSGWPAHGEWLETLATDHPLHGAVVGARRQLSALNPADDAALAGQGVAAVPVVDPRTQRVLGVIKVEMADARLVSADLVRQLEVLALIIEPRLQETNGIVTIRQGQAGAGSGTSVAALTVAPPVQPALTVVADTAAVVLDGAEAGRPRSSMVR